MNKKIHEPVPWQKEIIRLVDYLNKNDLKLHPHPRGRGYITVPKDWEPK